MNIFSLLALILTIAGWGLFALTGMHLLSGYIDERSCQTDCVQMIFISAVVVGFSGLILGGFSMFRTGKHTVGIIALLLALPLCTIFATFLITALIS